MNGKTDYTIVYGGELIHSSTNDTHVTTHIRDNEEQLVLVQYIGRVEEYPGDCHYHYRFQVVNGELLFPGGETSCIP